MEVKENIVKLFCFFFLYVSLWFVVFSDYYKLMYKVYALRQCIIQAYKSLALCRLFQKYVEENDRFTFQIPVSVSWHPQGTVFFVASSRGDIQVHYMYILVDDDELKDFSPSLSFMSWSSLYVFEDCFK